MLPTGLLLLAVCFDPPLSDCARFPPAWVAHENFEFADRHCQWVKQQLLRDLHNEDLQEWYEEACRLRAFWSSASCAVNTKWEPEQRRQQLEELRVMMGTPAYENGEMWPVIPWWRFRR